MSTLHRKNLFFSIVDDCSGKMVHFFDRLIDYFLSFYPVTNSVNSVALGSVWFLPHDAPKDPSLGGKVSTQIII